MSAAYRDWIAELRISANLNTDFGHREHLPNEIGVGGKVLQAVFTIVNESSFLNFCFSPQRFSF